MNWQETVMNDYKISELIQRDTGKWAVTNKEFLMDCSHVISKAQAQATWEARQKEVDEAEQRGIRKVVVDMTITLETAQHNRTIAAMWTCLQKWQAFLKEHNKEGK